ncbi:MAG: DUF2141 domain-containing protein [Myxococcota bacterium]
MRTIGWMVWGSMMAAAPAVAAEEAATVVLEVKVENTDGQVGCNLFRSADGFPSDRKKAVQSVASKKLQADPVLCTFKNVAPGTYAAAVMHDEDGDGELDSNLFGVPTEGYGATNNKLPRLASPKFDASSFKVAAGETKRLVIKLKY